MSNVSIVVPVHQGGAAFRQCAEALEALKPLPQEIIAVFDGPDPASEAVAEAAGMTVLVLPGQQGASVARNAGAANVTSEWILFIDADVLVRPSIVGDVGALIEKYPDVAAIFGSYDDKPAHPFANPSFLSQYRNLLHHYTHQTGSAEASTFWGACGVIKRDIFEVVGGYDPNVRGIEDIELGYRVRAAGHRIRLEKSLQVKHLKQWTFFNMLYTDIFLRGIPWTMLIWRYRDAVSVYGLNIDQRGRASVAMAWLLVVGLVGLVVTPYAIVLSIMCALGIWVANRDFYLYLRTLRGWRFALAASVFHGLYFFYSGLAYIIGTVRYWLAD